MYLLTAMGMFLPPLSSALSRRWDGWLLPIALALSLLEQARELPGQNVVLAAVTIALLSGLMQALAALSHVVIGTARVSGSRGTAALLPMLMPLAWVVSVLTSRGAARLILRRWRTASNYGLRLLGLTSALVVLMNLGLQSFAAGRRGYWSWIAVGWSGSIWLHLVGSAVAAVLILAVTTPILIDKRPATSPGPMANAPLVALWSMLNLLFLAALVSS